MRRLVLIACLGVLGCGQVKTANEPVKVEASKLEFPRLAPGTSGMIAGKTPVEVKEQTGLPWDKTDKEFIFPWVKPGDRLLVVADEDHEEDTERLTRVRMETGTLKDQTYLIPRAAIAPLK